LSAQRFDFMRQIIIIGHIDKKNVPRYQSGLFGGYIVIQHKPPNGPDTGIRPWMLNY
jgi:hypothetical protein